MWRGRYKRFNPPRLKLDWSWKRRRVGDSFFVPTLEPYAMRQEGKEQFEMHCAVYEIRDLWLYMQVGVYKGHLGVLFTVRRRE